MDFEKQQLQVLVVGSGGREHALCWKLSQSENVTRIFCAPGNGGTAGVPKTTNVDISSMDFQGLSRFAKQEGIDLTVIGPDDPIAAGIVDHLEREGLRAFGPRKQAARLESSKVFAKEFMVAHHIPTARYLVFDNMKDALDAVNEHPWARVIKVDGLALGKGVFVCRDAQEAEQALQVIFRQGRFGDAGRKVVIEERLSGEEISLLLFCDGKRLLPMPASRDHKRRFDGDRGPNTGGMGVFSPVELYRLCRPQIEAQVLAPIERALKNKAIDFKGVLYAGLMIEPRPGNDGGARPSYQPYVLEFNARFGDPETQAILPLLTSDLLPILWACTQGTLNQVEAQWSRQASCCVVAAADTYPEAGSQGKAITIGKLPEHAFVFQAGTKLEDGKLVTNGGRVLAVTALGGTLAAAVENAYRAVEDISFEGMSFRKDIGRRTVQACLSQ